MLVSKVSSAKDDDELTVKFREALGVRERFAEPAWPLPNMKEVEAKNFWGWRSSYSFCAEAWIGQRKIVYDNKEDWATVTVYFVNHSNLIAGGFAVAYFHRYREEKVVYYEWKACDHEFEHTQLGNCYHGYTCKKCKGHYTVDSSG